MTIPLRETAYAKINLALHVRGRRADGYHELETLFAFAEDGDILGAEPADDLSLMITGPFAGGLSVADDNLVLKAANALRAATGISAGAALHLDKRLPVAAGIGGGSADAAAALRLLGRLWGVETHAVSAVALGADVPACLESVACRGAGIGDELTAIDDAAFSGRPMLLVNPRIPCPTGPVFAGWDGIDRGALEVENWREARNDLTPSAVALVPEVAGILAALARSPGANLVRMSGSGATCFALFDSVASRDAAVSALDAAWWHLSTRLRETGCELNMG